MKEQRIVTTAGVDLRVDTFGDAGDPAILLLGAAGRMSDGFCEQLAAGLRFVARYEWRDPRRSADADSAQRSDPADERVRGALCLLDSVVAGPAHVVAIASDASAALRLAVEHPDSVESLTLIGAAEPLQPPAGVALPILVLAGDDDAVVAAILNHTSGGWEEQEERLASRSLGAGDPIGWFDALYATAAAGAVAMPWDRDQPHPLLAQWVKGRGITGEGRSAIVVGCGLGADAEYIAALGFETVGFDVAATAVRLARERFPGSAVRYDVADLLDPPKQWLRAFALVVEVITVQALPDPARGQAIINVGRLVAAAGTLIAIAAADDENSVPTLLPPWPLSRCEIEAFASDGLRPVRIENLTNPQRPAERRWRAEFRRPAAVSQRHDPYSGLEGVR